MFYNTDQLVDFSGQWEIVPGSGPGMTLGPDEAEWRWNSLTQNWERTVVTGNSGASGGKAQKKYVWFRLLDLPYIFTHHPKLFSPNSEVGRE